MKFLAHFMQTALDVPCRQKVAEDAALMRIARHALEFGSPRGKQEFGEEIVETEES